MMPQSSVFKMLRNSAFFKRISYTITRAKKKRFLRAQRKLDYQFIELSGAFNREYYVSAYLDVQQSGVDPLLHFVRCGAQEGRDPSYSFDTTSYLNQYPAVKDRGINALRHFLAGKKHIVVVSDSASLFKTQQTTLDICKNLNLLGYQLHILLQGQHERHNDFESLGKVYCVHDLHSKKVGHLVSNLYRDGCKDVILSLETTQLDATIFEKHGYHVVSLMKRGDTSPRQYIIALLGLISEPIKKVSCIISGYSAMKLLPYQLNSILNQTYPLYEILLLLDFGHFCQVA